MGWSTIKKQCKRLHSDEDVEYATGCMRKKRFPSEAMAQRACAHMTKRYKRTFNVYRCQYCPGECYHVGSTN